MPELNQFQDYLVHEFVDDYNDGVMPRREMMMRIIHITGGVAAAATMLTSLGVKAADAGVERKQFRPAPTTMQSALSVAADDPRIKASDVSFESSGAMVGAYEARPAAPRATPAAATPVTAGALPLILVCHENRGLTDHIKDVTRRLATNGYVAVALDLVSREGGTAAHDQSEVPSILSSGDPNRHVADFQAALDFYESQPGVDASRVGMIGFCFGGGITWRSATRIAALKAAIPYYGPPPPLTDVPNIQAAVLGVYSSDAGDFANGGRDELEAALKAAGKTYEIKVYPGTEHAFNNDTGPRYNAEQAAVAWSDALAWFAKYV
ncbi:MAG TPA: dienelactone hydrolase family protein [Thermomicrobiales bacterium]|nr:dienelactone hydrolase family protein [Thermomicrobiales bacterium]